MFSGGPSFFVHFVRNDGALNLRLHVVALPESLTMSWPAKITSKLNMSGLDFLVPVLQSFNSFDLNAFFQVLFSLSRTLCKGKVNLLLLESFRSTVFFCARSRTFFLIFFRSGASNGFPVKSMFLEGLSLFCTFSVMLTLWICSYALEPRDYHSTCQNQLKLFESSNCRDSTN